MSSLTINYSYFTGYKIDLIGYTLISPVLVPMYSRLWVGSNAIAVAPLGNPW